MSPSPHRRGRGPWHKLAVVAAIVLSPLPVPAAEAMAGPPAGHPAVHKVTLLTGDVVTYEQDGAGHRTAQVEPALRPDRQTPAFHITTTPEGLLVYPSDALALVSSGALNRDLFNLTELVEDGRDDATDATIPVIARYGGQTGLTASALDAKAKAFPRTQRRIPLTTANGVGLKVEKAGAADFWHSLVTRDPAGKPTLAAGVSQVRLDRKVRVALDRSTAQVGAPVAWQHGLTGAGTTVAVVDTGIDAQHPDLVGKTIAAADFSGEGDTVDHHGHGTHVASIISGTGAASGGRYKGVAPDAKLVVAKVFDASGEGDTAQVMAGVDWAVGQGAKIVNLSLGAGVSDGFDPLSQQLDTLSAKNGTLFVVAAGNAGPGDRTVTTPGSASSALTVGALDRDNTLAWFSSRGPRLRDAAVKPEISAPGVGIAAARAAGTSLGDPVDDFYTRASGTSMATPHVAGAAAILLQQYPGLSGEALKNILVSTAKDVGLSWYEQGAGLLDVGRAVSQQVTGTAVASFGRNDRAPSDSPPVVRNLSYTNTGDRPLELTLKLVVRPWDGNTKPLTEMRLGSTTLSVPPKSTKSVELSEDPDDGAAGVYGGTVVATTADGGSMRTAVSAYNAAALVPVTVRLLDSAGAPADQASAQLIDDAGGSGNRNDPFLDQVSQQVDLVSGVGRVAVPAGHYSALGWVVERGTTVRRWSAVSASGVAVTGPAEITLNAANAVPAGFVTPEPTDLRDRTVMLRRVIPPGAGTNGYIGEAGLSTGGNAWEVRVAPAAATATGTISLQDSAVLSPVAVDLRAGKTVLTPAYDVPTLTAKLPGERTLPLVFADVGGLAGLDVRGKAVLVRVPVGDAATGAANAARTVAAAGGAAVLPYADAAGAPPIPGLTSDVLPVLSLGHDQGEGLRGAASVHLVVRAVPDAMYNLSYFDANGVPKDLVRHVDRTSLVATKTSYHADRPDLSGQKTWYAFPTGSWKTQLVQGTKIPVPGTWTEYTGPGDDRLVWKRVVTLSGTDATGRRASLAMNRQGFYHVGERSRPDEHWFRAPLHGTALELPPDHPARYPATANGWTMLCSLCRGGQDPDLFVPGLQWSDGAHYTSPYENARYFTGTTARLFRSGTEIPRSNADDPLALFPVFRLAADRAVYRLDVTDVMPAQAQVGTPSGVLFRNAPRTDTSWTFASERSTAAPPAGYTCYPAGTACSFQPLIQVDYRLPLDLANRAPAAFTFEIAAASHSGARGGGPVTQLRVSSSVDDGVTWTAAVAKPQGNSLWTVTVNQPSGEFVWLRTEARDSSGNTVTQTVQRAYVITRAG